MAPSPGRNKTKKTRLCGWIGRVTHQHEQESLKGKKKKRRIVCFAPTGLPRSPPDSLAHLLRHECEAPNKNSVFRQNTTKNKREKTFVEVQCVPGMTTTTKKGQRHPCTGNGGSTKTTHKNTENKTTTVTTPPTTKTSGAAKR